MGEGEDGQGDRIRRVEVRIMKKSKEKQCCKGAKRLTKSTREAQISDGILRLGRFSHSIVERVCQLSYCLRC